MAIVLKPNYIQRQWAYRQPLLAKERVNDHRGNYDVNYSSDESEMFWLGYLAGYDKRKMEEE